MEVYEETVNASVGDVTREDVLLCGYGVLRSAMVRFVMNVVRGVRRSCPGDVEVSTNFNRLFRVP